MEIHRAEPVLVNRICPARVKRTAEVGEIFGAVICGHCAVDLCNGQAKQIVLRGRVRFVYGRGHFALDIDRRNDVLLPNLLGASRVLREIPEPKRANMCGAVRFRVARIHTVERVDKRCDVLCKCAFNIITGFAVIGTLLYVRPDRIGAREAAKRASKGVFAVIVLYTARDELDFDCREFVVVKFGGIRLVRHGRGVLFPDRVNGHARSPLGQRNIWGDRFAVAGLPALEGVAVTDGNLPGERERCITLAVRLRLRFRHIGDIVRRVLVVGQGVGDLRVGILRNQIDRRTLVAGSRPTHAESPSLRVRIRFFAPANDLIAAVHRRSVRSRLDIADGDRVVVVGRVAVRRRVLAYKLRLFRRAVIVADVELIADIKNGERYIDLMAGIQRLRTDVTVSRKCRHRQHAEHHNQN